MENIPLIVENIFDLVDKFDLKFSIYKTNLNHLNKFTNDNILLVEHERSQPNPDPFLCKIITSSSDESNSIIAFYRKE